MISVDAFAYFCSALANREGEAPCSEAEARALLDVMSPEERADWEAMNTAPRVSSRKGAALNAQRGVLTHNLLV